jgi:hypothetical protein
MAEAFPGELGDLTTCCVCFMEYDSKNKKEIKQDGARG